MADIQAAEAKGASGIHIQRLAVRWRGVLSRVSAAITLDQLTYDWVLQYIAERRRNGARGQTIVRETAAIKRALRIAKRRGMIRELPDEWPQIRRDPPDKAKSGKFWPPELLMQWLELLSQDARDEAMLGALTGLRSAELKRIEASWVEPAPQGSPVPAILRIPQWAAKTRTERIVGLSQQALEILRRRIAALEPEQKQVMSQVNFRRARETACRKLGIDGLITLRDLRHTYATLALQTSSDPTAVQAALGHSDLHMTNRYLSTTITRTAALAGRVADALGTAPGHSEEK